MRFFVETQRTQVLFVVTDIGLQDLLPPMGDNTSVFTHKMSFQMQKDNIDLLTFWKEV